MRYTAQTFVVAALAFASCSDDSPHFTAPPNTFVTATVKEIKVETRRHWLFGERSKSYALTFTDASGKGWYGGA
jgi:hypothetical protein